jgi:exopolysaccharide biosynthesis polyprenyl glycosylphosphotransferase
VRHRVSPYGDTNQLLKGHERPQGRNSTMKMTTNVAAQQPSSSTNVPTAAATPQPPPVVSLVRVSADTDVVNIGLPLPIPGSGRPRISGAVREAAAQCTRLIAPCLDALALIVATVVLSVPSLARVSIGTAALVGGAWILFHRLVDLDRGKRGHQVAHAVADDVMGGAWWSVLAVAAVEIVGGHLAIPAAVGLVGTTFTVAAAAHVGFDLLWRRMADPEPVVFVGGDMSLARFERKLELEPTLHTTLASAVDPSQHGGVRAQDLASTVALLVDEQPAARVVLAAEDLALEQMSELTRVAVTQSWKVTVLPTLSGAVRSRGKLGRIGELPAIEFEFRGPSAPMRATKRVCDVVLGAVLLVAAAPLMVAVAAAVKISDGGLVFFRQERAGRGCRPFGMWKFRTMVPDAEKRLKELVDLAALADPMFKLKQDPRITRVGRFLRRTSLDELPQLINVLQGDMSLVGPRPEDARLVNQYDDEAKRVRCGMKPGITGPMQVHGRGELTFSERLQLERDYMDQYSLASDLRIMVSTVTTLLSSRHGAF